MVISTVASSAAPSSSVISSPAIRRAMASVRDVSIAEAVGQVVGELELAFQHASHQVVEVGGRIELERDTPAESRPLVAA